MKRHVGSAVKGLRSGQKIPVVKKKDGIRADSQKSRRRGCGASCLPTCVLLIRGHASSSKLNRIGKSEEGSL